MLQEDGQTKTPAARTSTLGRARPNASTDADGERARNWSEKECDGTSSTEAALETPARKRCLHQSARGRGSWRGSNGREPSSKGSRWARQRTQSTIRGSRTSSALRTSKWRSPRTTRSMRPCAIPEHEQQPGQTCERRGALLGRPPPLPTPLRQVGRPKARTFEVSTAKSDVEGNLLGNAREEQAPDRSPRRTLAVRARGPRHALARRGDQSDPPPPPPGRAESKTQNFNVTIDLAARNTRGLPK